MAQRKKTNDEALVAQGEQALSSAGSQTQNIALTPDQVRQMTVQQTTDLINLLQSSQSAQTTQLLSNLFQGLTQQNGVAAEALNTLLQVSQSQQNQGLQNVIAQHYSSAIGGQQESTNQLIKDIGEGEQSLRFLQPLGLQQAISELGVWQSQAAAGNALPPILEPSASESSSAEDDCTDEPEESEKPEHDLRGEYAEAGF